MVSGRNPLCVIESSDVLCRCTTETQVIPDYTLQVRHHPVSPLTTPSTTENVGSLRRTGSGGHSVGLGTTITRVGTKSCNYKCRPSQTCGAWFTGFVVWNTILTFLLIAEPKLIKGKGPFEVSILNHLQSWVTRFPYLLRLRSQRRNHVTLDPSNLPTPILGSATPL